MVKWADLLNELKVEPVSSAFLNGHSNFLQSSYWGELKGRSGWKPVPLKLTYRDTVVPLLVLVRTFKGTLSLAYVPHGPHVDVLQGDRESFLNQLSRKLIEFLPLGTFFIRYDLLWGETGVDNFPEPLKSGGMHKAPMDIQPPDTVIIDLLPSDEEILAAMHKKTRYNIGLASKKGVEILVGTEEDLDDWYDLYKTTSERDKIALHSLDYYKKVFAVARETAGAPEVKLLLAKHENDLLAGIVVVFDGTKATYLYGASSNIKRSFMPAYSLQWEAMKMAKAKGCESYDMFGIPPSDAPDHPMHGLYRFKTGFGGIVHHRLGAWDFPYSHLFYPAFRVFEAFRKFYYKTLKKR
jgi:lipid II:glycine glycyltransferase (peptidoglycan interpeptide bridge formation enzyme)